MNATDSGPLPIDRSLIGTLHLETMDVPYVNLHDSPAVHKHLTVDGAEYVWERSFPIKGGSAVMPAAVAEMAAAGKKVLVVERDERYYVYLA